MPQNRNKLIDLFIGNISNAIVHEILERAVKKEELTEKYRKELINSFEIAMKYREKINPLNKTLPVKDVNYIKTKINNKIKNELSIRISKGYQGIDLSLIEPLTNDALKKAVVL